ncbi:histidinol-phosphate transaminase [Helicobacter sp. 23-1046]
MRFNSLLDSIAPYEAGKPIELVVREYGIAREDIIKLASNENPYGTSPKVIQTIQQYVGNMSLYPDDSYYELKNALAQKFGVDSTNLIIGSGSDEIIEFCLHAVHRENAQILQAGVTFAMYSIYAKLFGYNVLKTSDNAHNLEQFLDIYKQKKPNVIFLCVPNNPLGECLRAKEIEDFITQIDEECLVVLDGAYQEYASYKDNACALNPAKLIQRFPNVVYLGTFSKVYGLGGMRIGYGIAQSNLIQALHKVRPPFNITTLSLKAAICALQDEEFVQMTLESNFKEMIRYENFAKEHRIECIPSYTNFITYMCEGFQSHKLCQWLLERGLIIRNLESYGLNAFRVTIGKKEQNDKVLLQIANFFATL